MKAGKLSLLAIPLLCWLWCAGYAQPSWVKDAVQEAWIATAPREASVIVLYDVTEAKISTNGKTKSESRVAYKILTAEGEKFGVKAIPVDPFRKMKSIRGWVVKPDGSSKSLKKENIMKVGLQESAGYYDDAHLMMAVLPEVVPGVVAAFEYDVEEEGFTSLHQSFVFQEQQPVKYCKYEVTIPRDWELRTAEWNSEGVQFNREENRYIWTAKDLPYQPDEPLALHWYYLSRRVAINCFDPAKNGQTHFADWPSVANWYADLCSQPALPNDIISSQTQQLIVGSTSMQEKVQAIASFSQEDIRYVAVEVGKGRWEPRPAGMTLLNRYGDCKDKTTLMLAMLKAADIPSAPALVSATYPTDPRLPTPFQFDHVIVAIPMPENFSVPQFRNATVNNWLFFDPTDPATALGNLPWGLQGSRVLVAAPGDSVFFRLPYPNPQDNRRVYRSNASLNEDGSFSAIVRITDFGASATRSRYIRRINPPQKQLEEWEARIRQAVPGAQIGDYQAGAESDSAWATFTISAKGFVQKAGDLIILRPDPFHAAEPPQLTAAERRHPVWFGSPIETEINAVWHLPPGWTAEIAQPQVAGSCDGASVESKLALGGNILSLRSLYRRTGEVIWPEDYEIARRFSKDLSLVRSQVVFLKQTNPGEEL